MSVPDIELKNLWFSYGGDVIVENAELSLDHCDFLVMIGPNGGGKTTLLKLMLGLLTPDRGKVRILGEPPSRSRHRLGYVPQDISFKNRSFKRDAEVSCGFGCIGSDKR